MPRRLRFQPQKNMIHVVSTRCIQGYSLLRPSQKVNDAVRDPHDAMIKLQHNSVHTYK